MLDKIYHFRIFDYNISLTMEALIFYGLIFTLLFVIPFINWTLYSISVKELPSLVKVELSKLPKHLQTEYKKQYKQKAKSLGISYFLIFIINLYYGYNRKWGYQIASWLTIGGFGIWIIIDIFRMPKIVKNTNQDIAFELLKDFIFLGNLNTQNPASIIENNQIKTQKKTKKCPHCGEIINADANFCEFCKKEINNSKSKIEIWMQNNPGKSINDYYKENK